MRRLVVTPLAEREVEAIIRTSAEKFGPEAARRYRRLLQTAFDIVWKEPDGPLARTHDDIRRRSGSTPSATPPDGFRRRIAWPSRAT